MLKVKPEEIEQKSFEIITKELNDLGYVIDKENELVVKRVIHASADFDYAKNLVFSKDAVKIALNALKNGCDIVTDTNMAKAGINKKILSSLGGEVHCFMSDQDVIDEAKERGVTRASISMEKASKLNKDVIIVIGNAPTALIELIKLIDEKKIKPLLVVGVPVGFVNVIESKELLMQAPVPYIVAKGRKGGSNIAAAIINALIYQIKR